MGLKKSFIKRLPPARWGLFIVKNNKDALYVMKDNSPISLIGLVMKKYAYGGEPVPPWSLHLHFYNPKKKKTFQLLPGHFSEDGEEITDLLKQKIFSLDAKCLDFDGHPVFMEYKTKKKLEIQRKTNYFNLQEEIDNISKPKQATFFDILRIVFGEDVDDTIIFPII
ncbi:MAG: hypothetical protein U9P70_04330 [Patescibacteria group bacterium]|nr:hypothetical protein [Patescibacteria group bacterium]